MKCTRRDLIAGSLRCTGLVAGAAVTALAGRLLLTGRPGRYPVNGIPATHSGQIRLIRPPGSGTEERFLARCIRCYRCQDACEPGAIRFFTESRGKHYHSPYVDPSVKACNLCMKCTRVCPSGALVPMTTTERAKVRMATVALSQDLCLSHKAKRIRNEQALLMEMGRPVTETQAVTERRGPCGECYMFCPVREKAIKLEPGAFLAPQVFLEHCTGCGMCEEICRVVVRGEPAIRVVPTRGWV